MAEIKINDTGIDDAIAKLRSLQAKCWTMSIAPPATVGGGRAVNELEAAGELYKATIQSLGNLMANTINFLNNVKRSYATSDKTAARAIAEK